MSKAYFVLATAFVWEHSLATQQPTEGIAYWFVVSFTFRQGIQISIIFTSTERRKLCSKGNVYVFIPTCWFVCLLAILRENAWTDFHESCRIDPTWYKVQSGIFWRCSIHPLAYMISFSIFGEIRAASNITKKWENGFSWNFQDRSDMSKRTVWMDFFSFLFSWSVLSSDITEK